MRCYEYEPGLLHHSLHEFVRQFPKTATRPNVSGRVSEDAQSECLNPDFPLDRYHFVVMLMDMNCQAKNTFANCVPRYEVNRTFFKSPGLRCSYLQRAGCGGRRALPDNLKKARLTPF